MQESFGGDKKIGTSFLHKPEQAFIQWAAPRVPVWFRSHHLTLLSLPISFCIIFFGFLGSIQIHWLWGVSLMIFLQWMTDSLDGPVGRLRHEGLVRWGYYMDHFFDYIFLAAVLIGYMLLLPDQSKWIHFFVLAIFGAFMVNSYLAVSAVNEFRIAHFGIGPTEIRLIFMLINTLIIFFGKTHLVSFLPYVLGFATFGLGIVVYEMQKKIWAIDMKIKAHNKFNI